MNRKIAFLLILVAVIFWAITYVVLKWVSLDFSVLSFMGVRFLIAAFALAPFVLWEATKSSALFNKRLFNNFIHGILAGGLLFGAGLTQFYGVRLSSATYGAYVSGLYILMTPILCLLIFQKKPKVADVLAAVLALLGVFFFNQDSAHGSLGGTVMLVTCAFFYSSHVIYLSRIKVERPIFFTSIQLLTVGCFALLGSSVIGESKSLLFQIMNHSVITSTWAALIFLSLFSTAISFLILTYAQKYLTPNQTTVLFSLEPVIAGVIAYFTLGESFSINSSSGSALILLAVTCSYYGAILEKLFNGFISTPQKLLEYKVDSHSYSSSLPSRK